MPLTIYYILHVFGLFLLTALTFQAFAAPKKEKRRTSAMMGGILSLIVLVAGVGLIHKQSLPLMSGWVAIKFVAWLGMSALSGMAYRNPGKAGALALPAAILILAAVWAVYTKPF